MQAAAGVTALVALVWISTLGVRLASDIAQGNVVSDSGTTNLVAATAAAGGTMANQFSQAQAMFRTVGGSAGSSTSAASEVNAAPATVLDTASSTDDTDVGSSLR